MSSNSYISGIAPIKAGAPQPTQTCPTLSTASPTESMDTADITKPENAASRNGKNPGFWDSALKKMNAFFSSKTEGSEVAGKSFMNRLFNLFGNSNQKGKAPSLFARLKEQVSKLLSTDSPRMTPRL